jgi:hypothetical protein
LKNFIWINGRNFHDVLLWDKSADCFAWFGHAFILKISLEEFEQRRREHKREFESRSFFASNYYVAIPCSIPLKLVVLEQDVNCRVRELKLEKLTKKALSHSNK